MKKKCFISIAAFIMLSCMASSPQQSLQSRLFGFWASSGDEVTVLEIDKDSLYYVDEYPIVAMPYQFAGDSMTVDAYGTTIVQHISFRKDTLVMKNQWGTLVVLYLLNDLFLLNYDLLTERTQMNELFDKTITNQNPENDRNFRFGEI